MRTARLLLVLTLVLTAGTAFSQSSADLKRKIDALTKEINLLNSSLNETSTNKRLSLKQISALNAQIRLRERKINSMGSEIRVLDSEISSNSHTVVNLQNQLARLKKEYASMVLFAFRNQSAYSKLMFIFASQNFNQGYKRVKYLQQFSKYRQKQARYIEETEQDLNHKIEELGQNKKEKSDLLINQQKERYTLGKQKQNQSQVLRELTKQEKAYTQEISQKRRDAAALQRAIQDAIRREVEEAQRLADAEAIKNGTVPVKARAGTSILAATPESARLSSDFLGSKGQLPWPVTNGTPVEGFGKHTYGVNVVVENNGIDIKTPAGSSVRAVFSGTVGNVITRDGNKMLIIRHGEYFSVYSNLKTITVKSGDKVTTKQTIGTVATDSDDGTTQLHFEVWKGLTPVNPELWLAN